MTESFNFNNALDNGIAVIHSNQLETLCEVVEYWLREHPLNPLENEIILVQSNGMGQWLKHQLALNSALGIAAEIKMQLPSLFIWNAYRAVLGEQIPKDQPLAKAPLAWRLYRLLPNLVNQSEFSVLQNYLADDNGTQKRYQLAERLADLFDQYQVYRADWMIDWANGLDTMRNPQGYRQPLTETQRWQSALWRAILQDLGKAAMPYSSRASLHAQFLAAVDKLESRPAGIPRRIILFGLSSLPQQSLEAIAKLGKFCQILLFVNNPCRYYWADIIDDKELLQALRRRQAYKPDVNISMAAEGMPPHAPPLLAAWGKQGRDYIRLLDQFDDTQAYSDWHWPEDKINFFNDYGYEGQRTLLQRLQQSILDLEALPAEPLTLNGLDDSLTFHIAHSPQREVEILHDQLLARFEAAKKMGDPLSPRDIVVMVPDINQYAPHIRAVFGLIKSDDPRYIPYSLADQQNRGQSPFLLAVESLLNLPESRFTATEVFSLLEVPAIRARFGIDESALPKIHQWIEESGIRWGLNAAQRMQSAGIAMDINTNTWQFGLRRMLLGYAVGSGEAFNGITPYEDIGGLEAQWLGNLAFFAETLENYALLLKQDKCFVDWQDCLLKLLADFFLADSDNDRKILERLTESLVNWHGHCEQAGMTDKDLIPCNVVRESWLDGLDEPTLHQRFLTGRVNFCTLMPMRAIPFRLICLLGMNDGDYPRQQQIYSFDLMNQRGQYRPGDRSRRQDDQYLFLEALLSARQQLYISWVGRSIRDNSELPPSVLISQMRETLSQNWKLADNRNLLDELTLIHPLQAFSTAYVAKNRDPRLFSYAKEWFKQPQHLNLSNPPYYKAEEEKQALSLSLESLARFLKAPVKTFCNQTLKFDFNLELPTNEDSEPFGLNRLQSYLITESLLEALANENPANVPAFFDTQLTTLSQQGLLPFGGFAQLTYAALKEPIERAWEQYQSLCTQWPNKVNLLPLEPPSINLTNGTAIQLTGHLAALHRNDANQSERLIYLIPQALIAKDSIKFPNLLSYWVHHLACCIAYKPLQTLVIASDSTIEIAAIKQAEAYQLLTDLAEAYCLGLNEPLPVACKTAFAWITASTEKAIEKAVAAYEGNDWDKGEVTYDAYLARFFPSFAGLYQANDDKGFSYWADKLYRPIFTYAKELATEPEAQI